MKLQEVVKDLVLPQLEIAAEKLIETKFDAAFEAGVEAVKAQVKPEELDAIIELIANHVKPKVKEALLAQAEKISDKV